MGDGHASKPLKEEIFDEGDDKCVQNFEVEKLEHNEAMEFQSCSASTIQEAGGMDHCIAGMHEEHEKKPNKKLEKCLPCPRCGSFDTKFCYFNNYNVNQPRHFCRKCQRYWTAGGVLRNVPKGAGRRRSKSNTTHQKHGVLLDAKSLGCNAYDMAGSYAKTGFLYAQTTLVPLDVGQLVSEDGLSASSTMLSFGQQGPLCDVMATHSSSMQEPNMAKQTSKGQYPSPVCTNAASDRHALEQERHGTHSISSREAVSILPTAPRLLEGLGMAFHYLQEKDEKNVSLCSRIENMESNDPVKQEAMLVPSNCTSTHSDSGNTADDKATHMPSDSAKVSEVSLSLSLGNGLPGAMWIHPPWLVMPPGPLTWNWGSAYWHMPWFLAAVASSSSSGQHESQSVEAGPHDDKGYLWTPKTLNINDPVEAAQSSIWKTLGLDKAAGSSADSKKPFQGEAGIQDVGKWSSSSQHCNPAALSRSLAFNETA